MIVDPIDGSVNAKRGLPHHSISIAVASGDTMADVFFGYVYDFGPGEEWTARSGKGAWLDGAACRSTPASAAGATGGSSCSGSSPRTRAGCATPPRRWPAAAYRLRALGTIAVDGLPGRRRAARRHGLPAALPRGRRRGRAADRARGGRLRRLPLVRRPARRAARPSRPTRRSWPPAPKRRWRSCVASRPRGEPFRNRCHPGCRDRLEARRHRRRGHRRAEVRARVHRLRARRRTGRGGRSARLRLHGSESRLAPARRAARPAAVDRGQPDLDEVGARPGRRADGAGHGPALRRRRATGGALLGVEVGAVSAGILGRRVLGQYEFPILEPDVPARLLFVAPEPRPGARSPAAPTSEELPRWVALHETTHAAAVRRRAVAAVAHGAPDLTSCSAASTSTSTRLMKLPARPTSARSSTRCATASSSTLVVGPERRARAGRVQAFMAVIEGYAEHVMDAVGAEHPARPARVARGGLERRRRDRSGLLRDLRAADRDWSSSCASTCWASRSATRSPRRGGICRPQPRVVSTRRAADARRAGRPARVDRPVRGLARAA